MKRLASYLLLVLLLAGTAVAIGFAFPSPTVDTLCRYAPMADAVAKGSWAEAFHPRFGVGFPLLAGGFSWLTGWDGHESCVALSMLGWALATVPLFRLARCVAGPTVAWFAVALLVVCPQPLFWGFQGLRETWRMAATLAAVAALFERKEHPNIALIEMALAQVILMTFRCDTLFYAILAGMAFLFVDRAGWRTAVVTAIGVMAAIPGFTVTHAWTGWWVPSPHFIPLIIKVAGLS